MATTIKLKNVDQMVGHLLTLGTACTFVSCVTATPQKKALRADCPYRDVIKLAKRTGWLNMDYNRAVRRRIANRLEVSIKDVEYTNGESWHTHMLTGEGKATPVCVNKRTPDNGKYYLFLTQGKVSRTKYVMPNGEEVSYDLLKPWFYTRAQDDLKPEVRCVTLNNVSELRVRGLIVRTPITAKTEQLLAA